MTPTIMMVIMIAKISQLIAGCSLQKFCICSTPAKKKKAANTMIIKVPKVIPLLRLAMLASLQKQSRDFKMRWGDSCRPYD